MSIARTRRGWRLAFASFAAVLLVLGCGSFDDGNGDGASPAGAAATAQGADADSVGVALDGQDESPQQPAAPPAGAGLGQTAAAAPATAPPSPQPTTAAPGTPQATPANTQEPTMQPSPAPTATPGNAPPSMSPPAGTPTGAPATTPSPASDPWNYIVSDEAPDCPIGGPIFRIRDGEATVLAQGGLLRKPRGMTLDGAGNLIVADGLAGLLRVSLSDGSVSPIAYDPPVSPRDVAIDANGDYIVVNWPIEGPGIPPNPAAVYRITAAGEVTVIAQGVPLRNPHGLAIDGQGNFIVSDGTGGIIRVTPHGEMTLVVAGGGPTTPIGSGADVRVDAAGDYIVADSIRGVLHRVTPQGAVAQIHRGPPFSTGGPGSPAFGPRGVVIDDNGDYVLVDQRAPAVFRVTPDGRVSTVFQGGPLCGPADLVLEPFGP
jgi:hypothetical protein